MELNNAHLESHRKIGDCEQSKSIHATSTEGIRISWGVGVLLDENFKEMYAAYFEFPWGWGWRSKKNPFCGEGTR